VGVLNNNIEKMAIKLNIATDDRVMGTSKNNTQLFCVYTNAIRTSYKTIRRQKRSLKVAKDNLKKQGFDVEVNHH
jgi:hypothetical protein